MINTKETGYAVREILFGDDETKERLLEIKKDIIKDFIESIKNNNPDIENIWEHLEKYLINDGSIDDVFQDIFRWCRLSFEIPEYIDSINKVKDKISSMYNIPTSEELLALKSEIVNIGTQITSNPTNDTQWSTEQAQTNPTSTTMASTWVVASAGMETPAKVETSTWIEEKENEFIISVYNRASQQIWKKYTRWWTSPNRWFDCSGLRYWAFKEEWIKFSERLTAHTFSDADVDITKDQVKPWDFMFWDKKPWWKKKHDSIYHIEMAISKPYTKNWKTYIKTLWSSTDAKDDCGNYVGKWVQIREREMKSYRHYWRPTYYYQLAQNQITWSSNDLIATASKPSQDLANQVLSA